VKKSWSILVADDERVQRESMAAWLQEDGYTVHTAASGREAIELSRQNDYVIHFVDLKMPPGPDGIETMVEIHRLRPEAAVIIVTAYATVDTAVAAMKEGAQEYIIKPCNPQEISLLVERILKVKSLQRENLILRKKLQKQNDFHDILSKNRRMHAIFALIRDVADLRSTVLIHGESGTGKEMVARAIHRASDRAQRPFVAVSCAALAETLLESELFGHERGSFTGAVARKRGKFELAHGGTLFLDEIADISLKLQVDLLRVLQERSFFRVGGSEEVRVDVRVIAATNKNLLELVQQGRFRDDLYYRLNVIEIHLPALRERIEDLPLLAEHFVEHLAAEMGRPPVELSEETLRLLMAYDWPGNVRQLENAVERALATCHDHRLRPEDFAFLAPGPEGLHDGTAAPNVTLAEMERRMIEAALRRSHGNVKEAAAALGIDRSTLYDKLKRYDIPRSVGEGG
jgi:DNA-binding NtrC family response regulator